MDLSPFSSLLSAMQAASEPGCYQAEVSEDWLQGRAAFGGLVAALAVEALRRELGVERPLRALMTAFIGPVAAGPVQVSCQVLRSGKSVTWAELRITQAGKICATVTACLGGARESAIAVAAPQRPDVMGPEDAQLFPFLPGITPNFTQHYEMRYALGKMPMSASKESELGIWLRCKDAANFGETHVVALMDVLPPAVLQMFRQMKTISSVTWHLEMLDDLQGADAQDGEGWWFVHVHAHNASDGYTQQHATLYTPAGRAIAMSQQQIAVFA